MVTIEELLIRDGIWKRGTTAKQPPSFPFSPGIVFRSNGTGRGSIVAINGKRIPGIYAAEYMQKVGELGELTIHAYAEFVEIGQFKGITKLEIAGTGHALDIAMKKKKAKK